MSSDAPSTLIIGAHVGSMVSGCRRRAISNVPITWLIGIVLMGSLTNSILAAQEEKKQEGDLKKIEYSEETLQETQSLLNKIETDINELKQESEQIDQSASQKRSKIKRVESSLNQQSRLCRIYDYKLYNTEQEVEQIREDLDLLTQDIAKQQKQLQFNLQQIELLGPRGAPYRLLVRGASGVNEYFLAKTTVWQELHNFRQQLVDQAMLKRLLEEIGTSRQQTQVVSEQSQEERQSTENQLKGELQALESLMAAKSTKRDQMAGLQERQKHVAQIVRLLMRQKSAREQSQAASRLLASEDGMLPWPCTVPLVRGFSKDTTNEATYNPGVDLAVPLGSEVRVVASGEVLYAKAFKGYDNLVIVDHGGGMCSLYAFLDKIQVTQGEAVEKDAVVGLSGLLEGNRGPGVHFELRKDGEAIDPRVWFEAAYRSAGSDASGK